MAYKIVNGKEIKKENFLENFTVGGKKVAWYTWVGIIALVTLIIVLIFLIIKKKRKR